MPRGVDWLRGGGGVELSNASGGLPAGAIIIGYLLYTMEFIFVVLLSLLQGIHNNPHTHTHTHTHSGTHTHPGDYAQPALQSHT